MQVASVNNEISSDAVIRAIEWAEEKWGTNEQISILNYSVSGFGSRTSVREAVRNYHGLFVWAAGNQDKDIDTKINSFGSFDLPNLISVGAINNNWVRPTVNEWGYDEYNNPQGSNYSSSGQNVNIYAPGDQIFSTIPTGYENRSGTSMAAPFVSGVAALLLSINPALPANQLKSILLNYSDSIYIDIFNTSGNKEVQTVKKLNAFKAAELVNGDVPIAAKVTFDKQGGSGGTDSLEVYYKKTMSSITKPSRFGYTFDYYYDDYGNIYYRNTQGSLVKYEYYYNLPFDTVLYAHWSPKSYDLSYIVNGVEGVSTANYGGCLYTDTVTITAKSYDGYNFLHWGNGSTESTITFNVKDIVNGWGTDSQKGGSGGGVSPLGTEDISMYSLIYRYFGEVYYEQKKCITENSLITLADGSKIAVQDLTGTEQLLVWNLYTGAFDVAPIIFIDQEQAALNQVINVCFSDGTIVKVISEHAFWDFDLNKYVYLRSDGGQYIGHWFNKQVTDYDGNFYWTKVQLTDVIVQQEYTTAWSPITYGHFCYFVNDMLSMPGALEGLINIFDVDSATLKYDELAYQKDVEEYGLFTYEEFSELYSISKTMFDACGGQYLKVAIGKQLITFEQIEGLINRYKTFFNEIC